MLRHLTPSSLQNTAVIGAFVLTITVFSIFFVRAFRMKKEESQHLSNLPLDDEPARPSRHD